MFFLVFTLEDRPGKMPKAEIMFVKYRKAAYCCAWNVLKHHQNAEEAVQEAFIRVCKNLEKVEDPEAPKAKNFLITITRREALRISSRLRKGPRLEPLEYADLEADTDDDETWETISRVHDIETLKEAIKKLPQNDRDLIQYRYAYEYSCKEIGEILDISEKNVTVRLTRVRKKLANILKAEGSAAVL